MTDQALTWEQLSQDLQDSLRAAQQSRIGNFDRTMLAWLAIPPGWTQRLAQAAGFPGWGTTDFLDQAEKKGLCRRTEALVLDQPSWYPVDVAARLAPYLPPDSLAGLLDQVAAVPDERERARILAVLGAALPDSMVPSALAVAMRIQEPAARARALVGVVVGHPGPSAQAAAERALAAASQAPDPGDRAQALLLVVPVVAGAQREWLVELVLELLPALAYESERGRVLASLAPHVPGTLVGQVLDACQALRAGRPRIEALAAATASLPAGQAISLLAQELEAVPAIENQRERDRATRMLARALAERGAFDHAEVAAGRLADARERARALATVAGVLSVAGNLERAQALAAQALEGTVDGEDLAREVAAMSEVVHRMVRAGGRGVAGWALNRVVAQAVSLDVTPRHASALASCAAVAGEVSDPKERELAERALRATGQLEDRRTRCDLYLVLATALNEPLRRRAAKDALVAARQLDGLAERVEALVDLVPFLDGKDRAEAIDDARAGVLSGGEDLSFWMPDPTRAEVLDTLARDQGQRFLHKVMGDIVRGLAKAGEGVLLPPAMARWQELAKEGAVQPAAAAAWLDRKLKRLAETGESGQALAWVDTARLLIPVMGQDLELVVSLGTRRVELLYRQSLDSRHLRHFVTREEQVKDFKRLLDDPDHWALHYIGMGGVGKTMLLRHVTAALAPKQGVPIGRVDFDHLSADFPITKPGQLLLELMEELQSYAESSQQESIAYSFRSEVANLHDAASGDLGSDPLANLHSPSFDLILGAFADFLTLLPQPVVLILDTCEELARYRSAGAKLPAVEATFDILERLNGMVRGMRVVFAGRRLLAQSGHEWALDSRATTEAHSLLPKYKRYLGLHEIKGFKLEEAEPFLTSLTGRALAPDMLQAILARSQAPGRAVEIDWGQERPQPDEPRYNPFDLNLYGNWVREEPSVTPELIRSGTTDPYISIRIVRRLRGGSLEQMLPAVALLGRFERSVLQAVFAGSGQDFDQVYRDLSGLEWIEYQPDLSGGTSFLEVDRNLRPRLLGYYEHPERSAALTDTRLRLGSRLRELIEGLPLGQIGVDLLDATMRLLVPNEAARLWHRLATQVRAEANWPWAAERTSRLLGADGALSEPDHPARAAVLATQVATLIHTQRGYDPTSDWQKVAREAGADPDPVVATWLRHRAMVGQVAAGVARGRQPLPDSLVGLWELLDGFPALPGQPRHDEVDQLAGSCCAALEALVEAGEGLGKGRPPVPEVGLLERWVDRLEQLAVSPELVAFARVLVARCHALTGHDKDAAAWAMRAAAVPLSELSAWPSQRWADWEAPASLPDRVRLELLRGEWAYLIPLSPLQLGDWQQGAETRVDQLDGDRLVSAILEARLAVRPVDAPQLESLERSIQRVRAGRKTASQEVPRRCHQAVPPLPATLARCWLALGRADRAIAVLDVERRALRGAGDTRTARLLQRAQLQVFRRMRLPDRTVSRPLAGSGDLDDESAAWPLIALTEPPGTAPLDERPNAAEEGERRLHLWWRCQAATEAGLPDGQRSQVVAALVAGRQGGDRPYDRLALDLDVEEARLMGWGGNGAELVLDTRPQPDQLGGAEPWARLVLRATALPKTRRPEWATALKRLPSIVGVRRAAELALDEGELLALRLPDLAAPLLRRARDWFGSAEDPVGALLAATVEALARLRTGEAGVVLDQLVEDLGRLYHSIQVGPVHRLPPWEELPRRTSMGGSSPRPQSPPDPAWEGWLLRLSVCLAWIRRVRRQQRGGGPPGEPSWTAVAEELGMLYGSGVPAELELPPPGTRPKRPRRWSRLRTVFVAAGTGLQVVFNLLLGFAILGFTGWFVVTQIQGAARGQPLSIALVAAMAAALLAFFLRRRLSLRVVRWIRSWPWSRVPVLVGITPTADTAAGPAAKATVGIVVSLDPPAGLIRRLLTGISRPRRTTYDMSLPPSRTYEISTSVLPEGLRDQLTWLARRLGPRRLPVMVSLDEALDPLPWEALLGLAGRSADHPVSPFDFWRYAPLPTSALTPAPPARRRPATVTVIADAGYRLLAERGWSGGQFVATVDVDAAAPKAATPRPDLVHVIGRPVRTGQTILVQVAEQVSVTGTSQQELRDAVRSQAALEPQDVATLGAHLVVVQGAPVQTSIRLDTERRDAAELRGWAAEVFRAGGAAVLLLPSVHPQLAESVLAVIAGALRGGVTPATLDRVTRAARDQIATWTEPDRSQTAVGAAGENPNATDRRLELALEVCLFRRSARPGMGPQERSA